MLEIHPGLGQAQKCGRVKPVQWDTNPPLLITGFPTVIYIYKEMMKNLHRFTSC
jgi:hypothetical protein